jgi:hypothetical protein
MGTDAANIPADADLHALQTSIEMPCIKCGAQMRLATIEPRDQNYDVLTYRCTPCDSGESFLKAR